MTKVTGKPQASGVAPVTRDNRVKTSSQLRSKKNVKVAKVPVRVNNHLQAKLTKKTSRKPPTTRKCKRIRVPKLCSWCSKVNEEVNQNGPEEVPESVESPVIQQGRVE